MSGANPHRLWPVLTVLVGLVAGAQALEMFAERRSHDPVVIEVRGQGDVSDGDEPGTGVEDSPETGAPLDSLHADARAAARRGEFAAALPAYRKALESHPGSATLQAEYGFWLLVSGDLEGAERALDAARELAPRDPWTLHNLGLVRKKRGDLAGAERAFRDAIAVRGAYTPSQIALATLLLDRKAYAEAISVIDSATRQGGNDEVARALVVLGRLQLAQGDASAAQASFDRAIGRAPAAVDVRVGIARAWLASGADAAPRALAVLQKTVEMAPDVAGVQTTLGRALEAQGDARAAQAAYERALHLAPDDFFARRRLLRLALDRRDYAEARVHSQRLLTDAPTDPEHHFLAGLEASREGRRDEARGQYREAIRLAGNGYPEAWVNLGLVEKADGKLDAAISDFEQALRQRPDYPAAFNNLSLAYAAAGRPADAEAALRRALELDPGHAAAWLNLGNLQLDQKRYDEAVASFQKALGAREGYAKALVNLGGAYSRLGRKDDAIATYRQLVEKHPRYAAGWYRLGTALEAVDRPAEALDAYARATAIDPSSTATLRRLAQLELGRGKTADSDRHFQELLELDPEDHDARLAVAAAHRRGGDLAGCAVQARAVLAASPGDPEAKSLLTSCESSASARP